MHSLKAHFTGKKHVIWDWNGTLLDDAQICLEVMADLLSHHGLRPVDMQEYRRVFRFPVIEYYRDVGFDFDRVPFEVVAEDFMNRYKARVLEAPLFDGVATLLGELRSEGLASSVLSAAPEAELNRLLGHHGIAAQFDRIYGLNDHFARSKVERGRQLLADLAIEPDGVMLVGDTDHDLEVGESMGVDVLLVDGGHQCGDRLAARHHRVARRAAAKMV